MAVVVAWNPAKLRKLSHTDGLRFLHRAGVRLTGSAKQKCPVDTGRLRASITYTVDALNLSLRYGSNVHYAIHQEVGTSRMAGKHYLENALREQKPLLMKEWTAT